MFLIGIFLTTLVASFWATTVSAATLSPATYSVTFNGLGQSGSDNSVGNSGAPVSRSANIVAGTYNLSAAGQTTSLPYAMATATSEGCLSGCAGGGGGVFSAVQYYLEVTGPAGVLVPFLFDTAGAVEVDGEFHTANAGVRLVAPAGLPGFYAATSILSNGSIHCEQSCVTGTQSVSLLTQTVYSIVVRAGVQVSTNRVGSATAWADPYIYIDPGFASRDQFTLNLSHGVGNYPISAVPVPAGLALLATALLGLAAFKSGENRGRASQHAYRLALRGNYESHQPSARPVRKIAATNIQQPRRRRNQSSSLPALWPIDLYSD